MAKRRKKLKQKLLTYGEIDRRIVRHHKKNKSCSAPLYGSVYVAIPALNSNHFVIRWYGNLRRAGGPDDSRFITIARVFALSDGDTGYVVHGAGKSRNNTKADHAEIKVWRRYVGVFTPHDPSDRLTSKQHACYRVSNGVVTPDTSPLAFSGKHPIMNGCWWTMPTANRPNWQRWKQPFENATHYQTVAKLLPRAHRFANDLKKQLADGPTCAVQLLHTDEGHKFYINGYHLPGLQLHVCLPPTRTAAGKRLIVHAAQHSGESRALHHVDADYCLRHSQYIAVEQGSREYLRWKCGKEALVGIKEWVLGSIYIPGPE